MIRSYTYDDYDALKGLYQHTEWYGGVFDEARDGRERLAHKIAEDPEAIWLYERDGELVGTVSIIDDGRVAMLFRLVVQENDPVITKELYDHAIKVLRGRGHEQVLVYTPLSDPVLHERYIALGMHRGSDYTCYFAEL
jgi:N-acetylglutamate synthase-like GNAT family acetyltransferase